MRIPNSFASLIPAAIALAALTLAGCSESGPSPEELEAKRAKVFTEEFKPLQAAYLELMDKERAAANKLLPIKKQIQGAKASNEDNLVAELQADYEAADQNWQALKAERAAMERKREDLMDRLRKLGHKFPGD